MPFVKSTILKFLFLQTLVTIVVMSAAYIGRNLGWQAILYYSFACVLFIPYVTIPNKWFTNIYWILVCLISLTWCGVEAGHYLQEKAPFNDLALKIFYESNAVEMLEYGLTTVPLWVMIMAGIGIIGVIISLFFIKHGLQFLSAKQKMGWLVLLFIGSSYYLFFANKPGDKAGLFKDEYEGNKILNKFYKNINPPADQLAANVNALQVSCKTQGNVYVLVLGESTSRHHASLYGYKRNTTPKLLANKEITTFTDVISSNTSTVECLNKCLTLKNDVTQVQDFTCPTIIDIANACNFKTYWLSNQAKTGILCNSITTVFSRASTSFFAIEEAEKNNVSAKKRYDTYLLPSLQKALEDTSTKQNKLIVLHLMGCHFMYTNRYPPQFNKFVNNEEIVYSFPFADTREKLQTINDYDNAMLYQDYFLDTVFQMLAKYKNTQAIYCSDHGEELYDYRNFLGHTPQGGNPWLHDVPFITWRIPLDANINKAQPYQLNNFAHTLCNWMQIQSPLLQQQKNLFSFACVSTQRTLSNGEKYIPIKK